MLGIIALGNGSAAFAAAAPDNTPATVQLRTPDYGRLKARRQERAFQYQLDVKLTPSLTFWDRFWQKVGRYLSKVGKAKSYDSFWKYVMYALVAGLAVFVILKLLQVDFTGLFGRKAVAVEVPYATYAENIHEINFAALIEEAENQGDYRRAVRLYYLSILKNLTDKAFIEWAPAKTNHSYITELQRPDLRPPFEHITRLFEYVWYGGTALTASRFQAIRVSFQEFNQTVTRHA